MTKKLDKIFLKILLNNLIKSDLSLTELRLIAKNRNTKGYKSLSKDELLKNLNILLKTIKEIDLSSLSLSELKLIAKVRRIKNYEKKFKNELLDAFKKSESFKDTREIRKENGGENKIIRELTALYEPEEDYYKPQKVKDAFGGDYIEYKSNGDKDKILSIEEYLNMIRPYLSRIIDDHNDGWKIQLAMEIRFVSSVKDSFVSYYKMNILQYIYTVKIRQFLFVMKQTISLKNVLNLS